MKIELGGGDHFSKGDGFINVDWSSKADINYDLNKRPWDFVEPGTVEEIFSSHCLEHLNDINDVLFNIARICKVGAIVEFRVPHPRSDLAMVWDHKHVFGPMAARNLDVHFVGHFWKNRGERRLKLNTAKHGGIEYRADETLTFFKRDCPVLAAMYGSDLNIMKYVGGTCHEVAYHYIVVENEFNS